MGWLPLGGGQGKLLDFTNMARVLLGMQVAGARQNSHRLQDRSHRESGATGKVFDRFLD